MTSQSWSLLLPDNSKMHIGESQRGKDQQKYQEFHRVLLEMVGIQPSEHNRGYQAQSLKTHHLWECKLPVLSIFHHRRVSRWVQSLTITNKFTTRNKLLWVRDNQSQVSKNRSPKSVKMCNMQIQKQWVMPNFHSQSSIFVRRNIMSLWLLQTMQPAKLSRSLYRYGNTRRTCQVTKFKSKTKRRNSSLYIRRD